MKKTYIQPATRTIILQPQSIISSSDLTYGGSGNANVGRSSEWRFGDDDEE